MCHRVHQSRFFICVSSKHDFIRTFTHEGLGNRSMNFSRIHPVNCNRVSYIMDGGTCSSALRILIAIRLINFLVYHTGHNKVNK